MTINDKIKLLLKERNLTPSFFADEIGVNRASISHILSGRNRPSYDIIQKILRRFPDLGYEWMMEDDEPYTDVNSAFSIQSAQRSRRNSLQPEVGNSRSEIHDKEKIKESIDFNQAQQSIQSALNSTSAKQIERILIFYTDGTFKEYSPVV